MTEPESLHPLIRRQLRRLGLPERPDDPGWSALITAVSRAYDDSDSDRELFGRSFRLSSDELVQAQRQLRESISALEASLDATADGILVVDRNSRIVTYNHNFIGIWGLPASVVRSRDDDQALGFVLDQLVDPDQFLTKVRELYGDPSAESFDVLKFKDGRVIERFSRPQRLGQEIIGRVWSFRDVTNQRLSEAELKSAHHAALLAARSQGEFLANMSHEIRTPMNGIIGPLALMAEGEMPAE
ncbi:MAG: PAS-domain containing protein, partial [Candidatus Eisenbacteria bacterium]|nr:PAS-domain containing protein [Candidatus Eisenbacteria bacterium]